MEAQKLDQILLTLSDKEKKLFELVKQYKGGQTWWMSDFYEAFCELYNLDFDDIEGNVSKIRYRLNKLKGKGILKTSIGGVGYGGKGVSNSTHFTLWLPIDSQ